MASTTSASPTLTGIPLELKHQIFGHLTTSGEVSGRKFLKKHKEEYSGDLFLQFISALATTSLSVTCHQLRTEFGMFLATNAKQHHTFVVNNLDPGQLLLFRTFLATYRVSHQHSDSTIPPHLFRTATLRLELDDNICQSVAVYHKTSVRYNGHGIVPEAFDDFPKIVVQPKFKSHRFEGTDRSMRLTGDSGTQAKLAAKELHSIYYGQLCHGPDRIAVRSIMKALAAWSG